MKTLDLTKRFLNSKLRKWLQAFAGVLASVGLVWLIIKSLDWVRLWEILIDFPFGFALLAALSVLVGALLRALRWYILINGGVSIWQVFLTQNTGIGLNNLLPVRVASEPVQLALISKRYKLPFPRAFASLVAGNFMDLFATVFLMALGVLLYPNLRGASIQMFSFLILSVIVILILIAGIKGLSVIPVLRSMHFFQQMTVAFNLIREAPLRLVLSFATTTISWVMIGVAGWFLAEGLGIETNIIRMTVVLVAATFFTSAIPSLPAGIGTYHWAIVYTLGLLGISQEPATAFAFVIHLLVFSTSTIVAAIMLFRVGYKTLVANREAN